MAKNPQTQRSRKRTRRLAIRRAVLLSTLVLILLGTIASIYVNSKILYTQAKIYSYNSAITVANNEHDYNYSQFQLYGAHGYLAEAEAADEEAVALKEERKAFLTEASNDPIMSWASKDEGDVGTVMVGILGFLFLIISLFLIYPSSSPDKCGLSEKEYCLYLMEYDLRVARLENDRWEVFKTLVRIVLAWRNHLRLFERLIIAQELVIFLILNLFSMIRDKSILTKTKDLIKKHWTKFQSKVRARRSAKNKSCHYYVEFSSNHLDSEKPRIVPFWKNGTGA